MLRKLTIKKIVLLYLLALCVVLSLFAIIFYFTDSISSNNSKIDSIYFSAVTYFTVGYGDIKPINMVGKILVIIEGISGVIVNSIFTGLLFYIFLKPKNKLLLPNIYCFKYKNSKCSLTLRIGNMGLELVNPKCVVEIFRFENGRRIRVQELIKEWPYIEKVVYFNYYFKDMKEVTRNLLYKIINGENNFQICITVTAYDSYTNDLVYTSKIFKNNDYKLISEYEKMYEWKDQTRGKVEWKKIDDVIELNSYEIEVIKNSRNFSFGYNCE